MSRTAPPLPSNADVIRWFRANQGQVPAPYADPDPPPMLILNTIGARTGRPHLVPMRCLPEGDAMVVFATAHGSARNPDWYANLVAHPEIVVERGTDVIPVRATVLTGAERERMLAAWVARVPMIRDVLDRTPRAIPVVRLDPRPAAP